MDAIKTDQTQSDASEVEHKFVVRYPQGKIAWMCTCGERFRPPVQDVLAFTYTLAEQMQKEHAEKVMNAG